MKGLLLARKFYNEHGAPMLERDFSDILPFIAVGLTGSGSECYGFDDELSRDHDFEPAFCIFLPDEDIIDSKKAFALERAYEKLPKEFLGCERCRVGAVGGNRHGVIRTSNFFASKTGTPDGKLSLYEWLAVPEYALCEAVNGEIFADNYGMVTEIRERLAYYPEEVRLKKLAGNLLLMGQSGQYNYKRCILRGETAAAQLAACEFTKSALAAIFLINKKYMPYYKWSFRALKDLPMLSSLYPTLEYLISSGNSVNEVKNKEKAIETVCEEVIKELVKQGLSCEQAFDAERQAYIVNDQIKENEIRNMHILSAV